MKRGIPSTLKRRRLRAALVFAALTILAAGVIAVVLERLRPTVQITEAVEGPVVQAFYATGTLSPVREYPVRSNIEGTLTQMLVDKGDKVAKDQKLALVVSEDIQFKFGQAKADAELKRKLADAKQSPMLLALDGQIEAQRQQTAIARREVERVKELAARASASTVDLDRAMERLQQQVAAEEALVGQRRTRQLELERDRAVADAALEIAQWNIDQQTIRAPVDGWVLDRPIASGTRVRINDALLRVADVSAANLVMRAAVDEEDRNQVKIGQTVRMTLYSFVGEIFSGKVAKIYPQAEAERRTFEVDVAMTPADERFAAGMTGELAFIIDEKARAVVVPSQAVQQGSLWTVREGRLAKLEAELGLRSVDRTEVRSGLRPGETVVVSAIGELSEGRRVRGERVDPAKAADANKPAATESPFRGFN